MGPLGSAGSAKWVRSSSAGKQRTGPDPLSIRAVRWVRSGRTGSGFGRLRLRSFESAFDTSSVLRRWDLRPPLSSGKPKESLTQRCGCVRFIMPKRRGPIGFNEAEVPTQSYSGRPRP